MKTTTTEQLYSKYLQHSVVTTDSRHVPEGALFFALKGDNFNGNQYAADALSKGAAYAIIDEVAYQQNARFLLVDNVLASLQHLAHHHRQQFSIPVIGITGSNGKTTTKELLANVLGSHYPTHCTKGNFNNHIGVPLTLLRMPQDTEVAVIEMGANHVGEIAMLCEIAAPTHGLITNIGKAHIGEFGGLEGIKKGKSELYDYLRNSNGRIFTNEDESYLSDLAKGSQVIRYGSTNELNPTIPFHTHLDDSHPFVRLSFLSETGNRILANSNLVGHYNFRNICTALAVGRYFKVPSAKMKVAIEEYIPNNNRSQIMKRGSNTFLLDAYNANPTSVKNALEYFAIMQAEKRVAILGDMLELGDYTTVEHQRIITTAVSLGLDDLILVGRNFEAVKRKYKHFADVQQLKTWFDEHTFTNTHFLVKGSRSIQLEQLLLP